MPDKTPTAVAAHRRTGARVMLLHKAKLAAQKIRTEAISKKRAALAAAHSQAAATFAAVRANAFGQNLKKIVMLAWIVDLRDGRRDGLHLIEFAPDGSMLREPVLVPASMNFNMGAVDQGAQRIYFAGSGGSGRAHELGWSSTWTNAIGYLSLADYSFGTLVQFPGKTRGTLAFDPEHRKLYAPNASGGIYVVDLADNSFSEIGPFVQFGPIEFMLRDPIAVDPLHQKIYCMVWPLNFAEEPENNFLIINYDGSDVRKVSIPNGQFGPDNRNLSLDVDPVAGFVYGHSMSKIWRAPLDLSSVTILGSLAQMEGFALDRATHLVYWSQQENDPNTVSRRSLYRSIANQELQPQRVAGLLLPSGRLLSDIMSISLLTMAGEARDKLLFEKSRKAEAPGIAAQKLVAAHNDADAIRLTAHGELEDAHAEAEKKIAGKQEEVKLTRQNAQQAAREKKTDAAAKVTEAQADAVETRKTAHQNAQDHLAARQKQADDIKRPAQAKLDAKRQELQNS